MFFLFLISLFLRSENLHAGTAPGKLILEIKPKYPMEGADRMLADAKVLEKIGGTSYRVLSAKRAITPTGAPEKMEIALHNYSTNKVFTVLGDPDNPQDIFVASPLRSPLPSTDEFLDAITIASTNPDIMAYLKDRVPHWYRPMPALVEGPNRVLAVGMASDDRAGENRANEVIGVDVGCRTVTRYENGAPATSRATGTLCGAPDGSGNEYETHGSAQVTVSKDGATLWDLEVVRPHSSSGFDGSGVELVNVYYRGKKVFARAHVPILNVLYDGNACGPYRDWQNQESSFQAQGKLLAPGILEATGHPTTIHDSGSDYGNFNGVAIYTDGPELVLISELSAGWYRYRSEWRLNEDGTIKPVFAFSAVYDPCVCHIHHHHVYWRFDFDSDDGAKSRVLIGNERRAGLVRREGRFYRKSRAWRARVVNSSTGDGYTFAPGKNDGSALVKIPPYDPNLIADGKFARGDFWVLQYDPDEIDDSHVTQGKAAGLNKFVNHQSVVDQHVVVWYGGHFTHDVHAHPEHENSGGRIANPVDTHFLGPTLTPYHAGK